MRETIDNNQMGKPRTKMSGYMKASLLTIASFFATISSSAQNLAAAPSVNAKPGCTAQIHSTYLLGPDDELAISGPELDLPPTKTLRVDGDGDIQVPLVGRVHVGGLTVQQSEKELDKRLSTYIRDPQVALDVKELRSQPASVLGAVNQPGIHQVQGRKTLLDMISLAGGIRQDAGYSIRITRDLTQWGCIPLQNATVDPSGRFSVAQVNLQSIMEAKTPEENIQILPHDTITVPKAELVYVAGEVKKSGGFVLGEHQTISVIQAVALAEGLGPTADRKNAKILRMNPGSDQRVEIPVNLKGILENKTGDVPLQGNDILFIPSNTGKKVALRALEAVIQTGTGVAIYRP